MRLRCLALATALCSVLLTQAFAATGKIIKVLPEFMDKQGRTSLSPSLYERDAYQAQLRQHPENRSGMRFYVEWKIKGGAWEPLTLVLQLRGVVRGNAPMQLVLKQPLENTGRSFGHWVGVTLDNEAYKQLGAVTAWRATLWEGQQLLGEERSFLW